MRGGRDLRLLSTSGRSALTKKTPVGGNDRRILSMSYFAVAGVAFALTFLAELPDKSMFASLVLGTRYQPSWVWAGTAAAFTVHMGIAVTAGHFLTLLPHQALQVVVATLFVAGAAYLYLTSVRGGGHEDADAARQGGRPLSFWRVAGTSFTVVFLAEWG